MLEKVIHARPCLHSSSPPPAKPTFLRPSLPSTLPLLPLPYTSFLPSALRRPCCWQGLHASALCAGARKHRPVGLQDRSTRTAGSPTTAIASVGAGLPRMRECLVVSFNCLLVSFDCLLVSFRCPVASFSWRRSAADALTPPARGLRRLLRSCCGALSCSHCSRHSCSLRRGTPYSQRAGLLHLLRPTGMLPPSSVPTLPTETASLNQTSEAAWDRDRDSMQRLHGFVCRFTNQIYVLSNSVPRVKPTHLDPTPSRPLHSSCTG